MFAKLDEDLHFGYQKNGSLVVAVNEAEMKELEELKQRGEKNGVQNLRIIGPKELQEKEPYIDKNCLGALYSPDAGNIIPYEFTIALCENAIDNGVELRLRREVVSIESATDKSGGEMFTIRANYWEPPAYSAYKHPNHPGNVAKQKLTAADKKAKNELYIAVAVIGTFTMVASNIWIWIHANIVAYHTLHTSGYLYALNQARVHPGMQLFTRNVAQFLNKHAIPSPFNPPNFTNDSDSVFLYVGIVIISVVGLIIAVIAVALARSNKTKRHAVNKDNSSFIQSEGGMPVSIDEMSRGGSGCCSHLNGVVIAVEEIKARYIINCAGCGSDKIANMIGDFSFKIKPRIGDYLLLHKDQGYLAKHTIFPCPDKILGKGVLVQTTLWGNLILGPTARDYNNESHMDMTSVDIQEYIIKKCRVLVPSIDASMVIHAFAGSRAKSDRVDWIIEHSAQNARMIHCAGIDSPGLAGSPAIAMAVVEMLTTYQAQFEKSKKPEMFAKNPKFNPKRLPIITPKDTFWKGLKAGPVGKYTDPKVSLYLLFCKLLFKNWMHL